MLSNLFLFGVKVTQIVAAPHAHACDAPVTTGFCRAEHCLHVFIMLGFQFISLKFLATLLLRKWEIKASYFLRILSEKQCGKH